MKNTGQNRSTRIDREIKSVHIGQRTTDGDGVKLTRIIGSAELEMLDPFLLLDTFESDEPSDYIGGFPSHPHRGFETVTYLIEGQVRHKDSCGNEGLIQPGGIQWMTAGRGIVHSEMPEQVDGLLKGAQLWVNLPQKAKMIEPMYQEFEASEIAQEERPNGTRINVIAGQTDNGTAGPVVNDYVAPTYLDVELPDGERFEQTLELTDNSFIYLLHGDIGIGDGDQRLIEPALAILSSGDRVTISAKSDSRFLLVSAQPINEPVARGGPFVMNTKAEVLQAFDDFQNNRL